MLAVFEPLFTHYAVDAVASGHIHAYERTAAVTGGLHSGQPDPAGAVYLTVGCGGNAEGLYKAFDPRGVSQCLIRTTNKQTSSNSSESSDF
jgi:hypothetical protein